MIYSIEGNEEWVDAEIKKRQGVVFNRQGTVKFLLTAAIERPEDTWFRALEKYQRRLMVLPLLRSK